MFAAETIQGRKLFKGGNYFRKYCVSNSGRFHSYQFLQFRLQNDRKTNRDDIGLILKVMGKLHFIQNFDIDKKVSQILKHG